MPVYTAFNIMCTTGWSTDGEASQSVLSLCAWHMMNFLVICRLCSASQLQVSAQAHTCFYICCACCQCCSSLTKLSSQRTGIAVPEQQRLLHNAAEELQQLSAVSTLNLAMQLLVSDLKHLRCWAQAELHRLALQTSASAASPPSASHACHLRQNRLVAKWQHLTSEAAQMPMMSQTSNLTLSAHHAKVHGI